LSQPVGVQVGKVCPSCGREESIPLLWRLPNPGDFELAERGLVALGGCMVMHDEPALVCRACEAHWGSDELSDENDALD
jgi:hypothetical protein